MTGISLDGFCHHLMDEECTRGSLHPARVARAFVNYFGLSAFPNMEEIRTMLRRASIGTVVPARETGGLRGYHLGTRDGSYLIGYDASDGVAAREHTLLHETYEIIRERVADLYPRVGLPRGRLLCRQADQFAAAALMQPAVFSLFAEATGLDVVALQRAYGRAYSSLTIRLAEVMRQQPLLAVLYERMDAEEPSLWREPPLPGQFRAAIVVRTPGYRLRLQRRPLSQLRGLLPRRGRPPASGSVVERVVQTGRPVCVERVSGI